MLPNQINGEGPKSEDGQCLVGPAEPLPDGVEPIGVLHLPYKQGYGQQKHRDGNVEALGDAPLFQMKGFGNNQAGTAESCVATGDGGCHYTEDGQNAAEKAQPTGADFLDHVGGSEELYQCLALTVLILAQKFIDGLCVYTLAPASVIEEIHGNRSPNQGYHALGNHGSIENGTAMPLAVDAPGHQRALRGMETTNGPTGNGKEKAGEKRILGHVGSGAQKSGRDIAIALAKIAPELRKVGHFNE